MTTGHAGIMHVAVVGAGTMGSGIAQVIAMAGIPTTLIDRGSNELSRGMSAIERSLSRLENKGTLQPGAAIDISSRIQPSQNIASAETADLVIEAVFEDFQTKSDVLENIDRLTTRAGVIATNTSSLSVTDLSRSVAQPERFLGMHFFNPVPMLPLVEIVETPETGRAAVESACLFLERIDKRAVIVKDSPGFIVNRLVLPQIRSAIALLEQGVASRDDIDAAMKLGASHPMGPLELADLIGLDVCLSILESLAGGLDDDGLRPPALLRSMVEDGKLGRKSGEGFYSYDEA